MFSLSRLGETAYCMHSIRLRGPWELCLPGNGEPQRIEPVRTDGSSKRGLILVLLAVLLAVGLIWLAARS